MRWSLLSSKRYGIAGAIPIVELKETRIQREIILAADDIGIKEIASCEAYRMQRVHGYIGLRGSRNISGMAGVTPHALRRYADLWLTPVHNIRMEKKMGRPTMANA